jgi:hypothetical protein
MSCITATFSILSDNVLPDDITTLLSFTPDDTVLKGSYRNPPRPVPGLFGWHVTCVLEGEPTVDEALSTLLERLEPLATNLSKLRAIDPGVQVQFNLAIRALPQETPLLFPKEIIGAVAGLQADLDIDFFVP